jgi:orotate phosphoribosyltransferase
MPMNNNYYLDKIKNLWYNTERKYLMERKRKMANVDVLKMLKDSGALLQGHFELRSGLHTDCYVQAQSLLNDTQIAEKMGKLLADRFRGLSIEAVVGLAKGAIVLAHEVARSLRCTSMFAERFNGAFQLRRGQRINDGDRILIIEDVVSTGKSTGEVIELIRNLGGKVVGLGCLVDRSERAILAKHTWLHNDFKDIQFESLAKINEGQYFYFLSWECPHCRAGLPLTQ